MTELQLVLKEKTEELFEVYEDIKARETRFELYNLEDSPRVLVVANGTAARVVKSAVDALKEEGVEVGMVRPVTVWPFPYEAVAQAASGVDKVITIELNMGQMEEDVRLAVCGICPTEFYGVSGGVVFTPEDVAREIRKRIP